MAKKTEYPTRNEQGQFIKDESHRMILELEAAIAEYKRNPTAYAQGVTANAPKGKKTMSFSMPPMGDSEDWMRITRRMRKNGVPHGGYPDTVAGNRKMDAARELANKQLAQESAAINAARAKRRN